MRCPIDSVSGTSICTCAMCWRFQIGSNSPLANRKARMLSAASLPRKWSMRKIWLSSNVACSVSFSSIALARSVPNGFSMMMREPLGQPGFAEQLHHLAAAARRHAEVVEPRDVARRASSSSSSTALGQRRRHPADWSM